MSGALIAGSVAAPIVGGILGNVFASGDEDAAKKAREAALNQYLGLTVPSIDDQKISLGNYTVAGELNPTMEGTVAQGPSAMEGISTDPRLRNAQMRALSELTDLGHTGLTAQDRVSLMQIGNQASGDAKAASEAILQNMSARGMGGGGAELAARLQSSQSAANRESQQGMQIAAQAQQRALDAIMRSGQLGGEIRGQDFGEKSKIASAQDEIARFNAANRQGVMGRNTAAQNSAQEFNLKNKQDVANRNTQTQHDQEIHNKGLYRTNYYDQLQKAAGVAGQEHQMASYYGDQADKTRGMWSGIGQAVGNGMATGAGYAQHNADMDRMFPQKRVPQPGDSDFVGPVK